MKLTQKVSLAFKKLMPALKPGFGTKVITALTANADTFPNLPVKLSDLQAANDAVVAAIPLALNR